MKLYRIWFLRTVMLLALFEILTAAANYNIDPLWCFGNVNRLNDSAIVIDQRQEKTNRLTFERKEYDAILIGSSRSEPIPADAFGGQMVFNYSLPAIFPDEYLPYLRYAAEMRAPRLKTIYLGLDFFGSNRNKVISNPAPESYFNQSGRSTHRLTCLFSPGPIRAWIKRNFERDYYYRYDRKRGILTPRTLTAAEIRRFTDKRLAVFRENFYPDAKYVYNADLPALYRTIQTQFPGVRVVPFTSPVSLPLMRAMVAAGRYPDYERWLNDIVETFGGVYHFMYANAVTMHQGNFYDADHMYPETAELIAKRLSGRDPGPAPDLGIYITPDNLESVLVDMRQRHSRLLGTLEQS
jgi:hypothetical protein